MIARAEHPCQGILLAGDVIQACAEHPCQGISSSHDVMLSWHEMTTTNDDDNDDFDPNNDPIKEDGQIQGVED